MAQKTIDVEGLGSVIFSRRRGTKNLRLSIRADGQIRVGMPQWAPYSVGIQFIKSKRRWIAEHQTSGTKTILAEGSRIGKAHRLHFKKAVNKNSAISTRVTKTEVLISTNLAHDSGDVQKKAVLACERALKQQSQALLPLRLKQLSAKSGLGYKSLKISKLTSRWGSCSSKKDITLSLFLVQLPWELIDYVMLHELTHTKHLNHSHGFWAELEEQLPNAKSYRNHMKHYQPKVTPL